MSDTVTTTLSLFSVVVAAASFWAAFRRPGNVAARLREQAEEWESFRKRMKTDWTETWDAFNKLAGRLDRAQRRILATAPSPTSLQEVPEGAERTEAVPVAGASEDLVRSMNRRLLLGGNRGGS